MHRFCRSAVRALGVSWTVEGALPQSGAVTSNHLSHLDILLFAAIRPFVMVAKSDVRNWPLIGWLTALSGTVYVVRGGALTYPRVNRAMAEAYRSGLPVLFFPEGTTSDGSEVLPFRRGLFHSVLNEDVALRTAALSYSVDDPSVSAGDDVCWWGEALLVPHLFRLAGLKTIRGTVRFGDEVMEREDRFALSKQARSQVQGIYAGLLSQASDTVVEAQEAELVEVL